MDVIDKVIATSCYRIGDRYDDAILYNLAAAAACPWDDDGDCLWEAAWRESQNDWLDDLAEWAETYEATAHLTALQDEAVSTDECGSIDCEYSCPLDFKGLVD
jgi:hypothetical protein